MTSVESLRFVPNYSKEIVILPLPSFVKDPKCTCGKPASFMVDIKPICSECLAKEYENSNELQEIPDFSLPYSKTIINKLKFEWSVNQQRWYPVWGKQLRPKDWDDLLEKIRKVILKKTTILLDADWKKDTKELIIY